MTPHSISILIPAYNEEANLRHAIQSALAALPLICPDFEIVVVESGSTDNSLRILQEEAAKDRRIVALHQEKKEGMGSALREGYRHCSKEWVCHLEADLPFDFHDLRIASQFLDDFDFVRGYRIGENGRPDGWIYSHSLLKTFVRIGFHRGYNALVRVLFGVSAPDINFSFKLIRSRLVKNLDLRTNGWFIDTELVLESKKANARFKEIPIKYCTRHKGRSSVTPVSPLPILGEAVKYRFTRWKSKAPRQIG